MANLVKVDGARVGFPYLSLQYPITPPITKLQAALEAWRELKGVVFAQSRTTAEREEVLRFMRQFGELLLHTLFPGGDLARRLRLPGPLAVQAEGEWSAYPWELLYDGEQFLALGRGVVRLAGDPAAVDASAPPSAGGTVRMLAASARPLGAEPGSALGRMRQTLEDRFIPPLIHPLAHTGQGEPSVIYRQVEHATRNSLESALALAPGVVYFTGYADDEAVYLENEHLTADAVPWPWLLERISSAVGQGLRLLILNDSLAHFRPLSALSRTRELLHTGLAGVVRLEGRLARPREQDYLRILLAGLAQGHSLADCHLGALRRLQGSFESGWDWSMPRLYLGAMPGAAESPDAEASGAARQSLQGGALELPTTPQDQATDPGGFGSPPAPPWFHPRRRCFGREAELLQMASALTATDNRTPTLHFLQGAAGSGKTTLALELARRLSRRFAQVLTLNPRSLLSDPARLMPVSGLPTSGDPPGKALFSALARHLGAPPASNGNLGEWRDAIVSHCQDDLPRLLVLDRLESLPGYEELCEALQTLPAPSRVLVLCRLPPPLVPGRQTVLDPLPPEELDLLFGEGFSGKLTQCDPGGALLEHCRRDLFLARLLRRSPLLTEPADLLDALAEEHQESRAPDDAGDEGESPAAPPSGLPGKVVSAALPHLGEAEQEVLRVLALFPSLVHHDLLEAASGLPPRDLHGALAGLQWRGWADGYGQERYFALHSRIHRSVSERVLTQNDLGRLRPRLKEAWLALLDSLPERLDGLGWRHHAPPLLAWAEEQCRHQPRERVGLLHRLGVERVNLAEQAVMLFEEGDWRGLRDLTVRAGALTRFSELEDLAAFLHHGLLAIGETREDPLLQAQALNRLAAPELRLRRPERALPMLERALDLANRTPGWEVLTETYRLLARCHEMMGRPELAVSLLRSAVELAQQLGHPEEVVRTCQNLERIWARRPEEHDIARGYLEQQLRYLRQNGSPLQVIRLTRLKADLMFHHGQAEEAAPLFEQVLANSQELGEQRETAVTLLRMAACQVRQGGGEQALELIAQAERTAGETLVEVEEQGRILAEACRIFERRNQPEQALEGYLRIRRILEEMGDREALIGVLDRIGGLYFQLGEQSKSTQCYQERLQLQAALTPG